MDSNNKYLPFLQEVRKFIPQDRIYTDELRRLAWGTDASFYRLTPKIVIRSENEEEISRLLMLVENYSLPVTFRGAGTSLSGQAVSNSILIVAGKNWERYSIAEEGRKITLQPGIIGQRVNELLAPYGRKFSPDPASVKSAMIGGIVTNNASGMNCGTHANSDKVLESARIVLHDGTILDTGDEESRTSFKKTHGEFVRRICELRDNVKGNAKLSARISYKYSIKNVTGLNLLPFVRFEDPFEIIAHLMVGSEGTLAFLSQVTMRTEYDEPFKASAMLYFKSIREACRAVVVLKKLTAAGNDNIPEPTVKSAELLDYKSLSSVSDPVYLKYKEEMGAGGNSTGLTAVLTETKAGSSDELQKRVATIASALKDFETYIPIHFTDLPEEYSKLWAIRSGIFPSVGGMREQGTTSLIEDIAFHIEDLPDATADLQQLLARHGYDDACIYGHALEGNYHFIINQSFKTPEDIKRYASLMDDIKTLVVDKYDGSLKAEHGTGRNMAPFVRYEWGDEAFDIMKSVKSLFDPKGLLNPGVIFNNDPRCHLKNFKPLPLVLQDDAQPQHRQIIDKVNQCIECGFCEVNCVSCGFTLSSRQRIVLQREISRLRQSGEDNERLNLLLKQHQYPGNETCAGDGLCSTSCPMGINVSELTHILRQRGLPQGSAGYKAGEFTADHFAGTKSAVRVMLKIANTGHGILGTGLMSSMTRGIHKSFGLPLWTPAMPLAYKYEAHATKIHSTNNTRKVVYFPSCINQTMGTTKDSPERAPLVDKMRALLHKAGYEVVFPHGMEKLCCGTIWESKGMPDIADQKTAELDAALWEASEEGKYPVLCDQSPCLQRMRTCIKRMKLYEPAEFICTFLKDRLLFKTIDTPVAIHITCSMRKMGIADKIVELARLCSTHVVIPEEIGCCAFAGDRGFTHPELNAYALRKLKPQIEAQHIKTGYSNSRTCEIGLTANSGIPYVSIVYLVDQCTSAKNL